MSNASSVTVETVEHPIPSLPAWFAEVVLIAQYLPIQGLLATLGKQARRPRGRLGHYEVIDFLALLIGYAASGERTLQEFFERLAPFAEPFMALFGRAQLPHRSTLSRFLHAVDPACLEAVRAALLADSLAHRLAPGGLQDHAGQRWLVFDVDGTRQPVRQRQLVSDTSSPPPRRRTQAACAPGFFGRKRGEAQRIRTTILQAHTGQWLGTFGGKGNGDCEGELERAVEVILTYLQSQDLSKDAGLVRLDGLYGHATILAIVLRTGLGVVGRCKDYALLDHPQVQARLHASPDALVLHPETGVCREVFDVGLVPNWHGVSCRVIVTRRAATDAPKVGKRREEGVYEIFVTSLLAFVRPGPRGAGPLLRAWGL
jgi:hypothetical protein